LFRSKGRVSSSKKIKRNHRISSPKPRLGTRKTNRKRTTNPRQRTSNKRNSSNSPTRALLRRQARKSSRPTGLHRRLGNGKLKNQDRKAKEKMKRRRHRREKVRMKTRHHLQVHRSPPRKNSAAM